MLLAVVIDHIIHLRASVTHSVHDDLLRYLIIWVALVSLHESALLLCAYLILHRDRRIHLSERTVLLIV